MKRSLRPLLFLCFLALAACLPQGAVTGMSSGGTGLAPATGGAEAGSEKETGEAPLTPNNSVVAEAKPGGLPSGPVAPNVDWTGESDVKLGGLPTSGPVSGNNPNVSEFKRGGQSNSWVAAAQPLPSGQVAPVADGGVLVHYTFKGIWGPSCAEVGLTQVRVQGDVDTDIQGPVKQMVTPLGPVMLRICYKKLQNESELSCVDRDFLPGRRNSTVYSVDETVATADPASLHLYFIDATSRQYLDEIHHDTEYAARASSLPPCPKVGDLPAAAVAQPAKAIERQ